MPDDSAGVQGGEDENFFSPEPEPKRQVEPALQVCRYLLEMFSVPLLRSHATVSLVDRDRLQFYHANRSVILVSSAINFSKGDGKDKFIATIIAFHCLSLEQNGILETIVPKNAELLSKSKHRQKGQVAQNGNKLHFFKNEKHESFEVELTDAISRDPAMVGRSTVVLNATSKKWPKVKLVVKISWPTSGRVSETDFLKKASAMAEGDHGWAANHLPRVYYAEDVVFHPDSTLESVAHLFENAEFANGDYVYERRTLRIIIQERLYPLKSLTNVKEIGQVFLDVACSTYISPASQTPPAYPSLVHRWLYEHPGILHRDLSFNNIMCRLVKEKNDKGSQEQKVYGVLTDYDLSSWTDSLKPDYTKTSQQRTGTPPYMAHELLQGTSPIHLYRHDVESLFYIMLLMAARHTIGTPKKEKVPRVLMRGSTGLPYQKWFNEQDYDTLGSLKETFFSKTKAIELSPVFEDFRPWLKSLQRCFSKGFSLKSSISDEDVPEWMDAMTATGVELATVQFDDATLGGNVKYSTLIAAVPHLTGELKGLVIRGPQSSPVPASSSPAGAARVDTG